MPEEVGALVAALQRGPVEIADRLVDQDLAVGVLHDHPAVDHVHLADVFQGDAPPALDLLDHQLLVVEALGAQQGDGQGDRVDLGGAPGPGASLHGPDRLDLAGCPDDGDPRLGRQVMALEVEGRQGQGLVVEAAGTLDDLVRGSGQERLALPGLGGALSGQQRAVQVTGLQQRDQQGADDAAVLGARHPRPHPGGVGLLHPAETLAGRAGRAGDLPLGPVRSGHRQGPGGLVAHAAAGAEIPAQRASGAHLDQLGQAVGADPDGVAGAGGDAGPTLDAAVGVDHGRLELPEPELAGRLLDAVHLVADLVSGHVRAALLAGSLAARRWAAASPTGGTPRRRAVRRGSG